MAIDDSTKVLMENWAVWRLCRERPGIAVTNAYSLVGSGGRGSSGPIPLLNDEAFQVEQAVHAMAAYLRQAVVEYWLRSEPVPRKAQRCRCSERTYWRRLERAHEAIHTHRHDRKVLEERQRQAYAKGGFSLC